jgi:hypothetical protein
MNLQLKKFDPSKMADDKVCVFIGKRGTGKSTLVADILYHKRHLPAGIVMSATEEGNHYYEQFVPKLCIYSDYDREAIERVIARQKNLVSRGITNKPAFLLLDDCMYDRKFMKDICIRQTFMNGRHWKLFFILTMQYCMDLTPDLRANVDYVFILRENVVQNREKLYKAFFGVFPNFDMFSQVMTACTENYECLVLDNTAKSNKIQDCVFWYKAKIHSPFKCCSPALWRFSEKNYDPNHEKKKALDPRSVKKSTTLTIEKKK